MDHDAHVNASAGARGRSRRRTVVVGVAIASLVVVGGAVAASRRIDQRAVPTAEPPTGLPAPPAGRRWVGVGRTVVAVPRGWPVVPGIYCEGPTGPYVTITQWGAAVGCQPMPPHAGPPHGRPSVDVAGGPSGGLMAQLEAPAGSGGLTQGSLDASRTTLPRGWLSVPSGEPYDAVGTPTLTSEIAALRAAGFRVVRRHAAPAGHWRPVTTDPGIGTPARRGSTVVVLDHGAVASSATLTGRLQWVGGPAPGSPVPHPGTVHIVSADDSVDQTVEAGNDGRWESYLPPGTYRVLATSPGFGTTDGAFDACSADRDAALRAGGSVTVTVSCQLK